MSCPFLTFLRLAHSPLRSPLRPGSAAPRAPQTPRPPETCPRPQTVEEAAFIVLFIYLNVFVGAYIIGASFPRPSFAPCALSWWRGPQPSDTFPAPAPLPAPGTVTLLVTRADEETNRYRAELAALEQYSTTHHLPQVRSLAVGTWLRTSVDHSITSQRDRSCWLGA